MKDYLLKMVLDKIPSYFDVTEGSRLDDSSFMAWPIRAVQDFLESKCGLSKAEPTKGKQFTLHHEAFKFWRCLINKKRLETPFEITHIDAHSDLKGGDRSHKYIMTEILHRPIPERTHPKEDDLEGLNAGNYLAFAVACRWIYKLTFVLHPQWVCEEDSMGPYHFKNFDTKSGYLQLKKLSKQQFCKLNVSDPTKPGTDIEPLCLEPEVPLEMIRSCDFRDDKPYSFVFLTRSPSYTPKSSDKLLHIIMKYIEEIK